MKNYGFLAFAMAVGAAVGPAIGAEHDVHAGHTLAAPASAPRATPAQAPASGKAREAGYEGMEMMEATGAEVALAVQCAQAGRGIIILDRVTLAQCGQLPASAPAPAPAPAPQHQH